MAPVKSPELPCRRWKSPSNSARDSNTKLFPRGTRTTGETMETSVGSPASHVGTNATPPERTGVGFASNRTLGGGASCCAATTVHSPTQAVAIKHALVKVFCISYEYVRQAPTFRCQKSVDVGYASNQNRLCGWPTIGQLGWRQCSSRLSRMCSGFGAGSLL